MTASMDEKPPLSMLLGAAFGAAAEARAAAAQHEDTLTTTDASLAWSRLDDAMSHAAHGEDHKAEARAAKAVDLATKAMRRAEEIDLGLQQAMTDAQLYGSLSRNADTGSMTGAKGSEVDAWIAEWRKLPAWHRPQRDELVQSTEELDRQMDALLAGPASVSPRVSGWLAVRRVLTTPPAGAGLQAERARLRALLKRPRP